MRKLLLLLSLLFVAILSVTAQNKYQPEEVRIIENINRDWTFYYFPNRDEDNSKLALDYDDSEWPAVAVPHTWSTYETTGDVHPFIKYASERDDPYWWKGWGYYRKTIEVPESLKDQKIFLEFDGVQKYSKLYVNGEYIGEHKGGFTSFYFDITDHINFGEKNLIGLSVSNRRDDKFGGIPPMTAGNWNVYGGIYRDVNLVVTGKIYFPYQGSYKHEGGAFITTSDVDSTNGRVKIKFYLENEHDSAQLVQAVTYVTNSDYEIIDKIEQDFTLEPNVITETVQLSENISDPKLWSPETPYLYNLFIEVRNSEDKLLDTYHSPFGFRWFKWDYNENRLYVNGEKVHIHGTNRHQEYPWLGDAMPKRVHRREMYEIKNDLGHNFMRTAHYPQDPIIYDLTDSLGIITVEEVPNIKSIDFGEDIQEMNVREMIRRDRNHPSIFFWSMGNETNDAADSKWAWEEDTTRIIHGRKTEHHGDYLTHDNTNLDMENLLRITPRGWYNKDVRNLEPKNTPENPKSGQSAGTEEWQHIMARVQDGSIRGRIDENIVAWLYNDHGADREYENAPLKHINPKGWVDLYRIPKYIYYLWQANYAPYPMVFIQPFYWQQKYIGQKKYFQVDSNCDEVELLVNGESMGVLYPNDENFHTVRFEDILVQEGTIKAVARTPDTTISYSITMPGDPYRLTLATDQKNIPADRTGITIFTVDVEDENGYPVLGVNPDLRWEVEGPVEFIAPELYETDIDKNWAMEGVMYTYLPIQNIIRTTDKPGMIKVKVSADNMLPAEISIRSFDPYNDERIIVQPRLSDSGRSDVKRDSSYQPEIVYKKEIDEIRNNQIIDGNSREEYKQKMTDFIQDRSQITSRTKPYALKLLIDEFADYLVKMNGELVADDYNFMIKSYNDARTIEEIIELKNFHPRYQKLLQETYAKSLIENGKVIDINEEKEFIFSIPNDSRLVIFHKISDGRKRIDRNNALHQFDVYAEDLEDILTLNYSGFANLTGKERTEIFSYLDSINPNIESAEIEQSVTVYIVKEDAPLWIPHLNDLRKRVNDEL